MGGCRSLLRFLSFLPEEEKAAGDRDYFKELGVTPIVSGAGTFTRLIASRSPTQVFRAIDYASRHDVRLDELHDRVGERIASLLGSEATMVPSGAAAALIASVLSSTRSMKVSFDTH